MISLHEGQGAEIYFRDIDHRPPTIEEYYKICLQKTGGLFNLSIRLLIKSGKHPIDFDTENLIISLAEQLGKFYQIRDDYLNIFEGEAEDLLEGKFTLPTIFAEDLKYLKGLKKEGIKEILEKLKDCEADKLCLRTLSEMAIEMETFIFEIDQKTGRSNGLKEFIYSLV